MIDDDDNQPLLLAPLVTILATLALILFAQVLPAIRGTAGGLPTAASIRALLGH